ncbi:MAG: hypothetical protein KC433_14550 [Anaerolineales bacterium]|nr:hypothetical protein [Anaerolineales bacterium]MCB8937531.1 hypothetical protein [Ardenticatenaceae bacterium]
MRSFLRFLAGIVAIFFVITAVLALFLTNLFTVIANRELIKDSLADLDSLVVETVPTFVAQTLEQQAQERGLAPINLDEELLQQSMETLLPPGWIDKQADTAVDTVYNMLESGDLENAQLEIDATPILDRFRGEPGQAVVNNIVASLPVCTQPVNPAELLGPEVTIPDCLPPGVPTEQVSQEVHLRLVQALDSNPQLTKEFGVLRVPLFSPEQQAQNEELVQARDQLLRLQRTFAFMQQWGWLLWLLPFSCLLLITLLAVRSWSEWGLWWGWPMAGTAVIVLFISLIFPAITTLLLRQLPADPTVLAGSVQLTGVRMVTAVTDTWLNRVNVQAAIMFVVGILFLLLGFVTRKREANW